jgi:hypothetical protein
MTFPPRPVLPSSAEAAVLLVLLPAVGLAPLLRAGTLAALATLQQELGPAIRVLTVDEASHPSVVLSFHATELPAFVLMRHGAELWRQQGLPEGEATAAQLLSKLAGTPLEAPV